MNLKEKLDLLNKYSTPSSASYSDRSLPELSKLVDYKFKRVGGGRELVYANWNEIEIDKILEVDFLQIISRLKAVQNISQETKDLSLVEFFNLISA
jgi:hypothetical protein